MPPVEARNFILLTNPNPDTSAPQSLDERTGLPDPSDSPELNEARKRLGEARFRYAGALANRHTHVIFNDGRELRKGIRGRSDHTSNPQFQYEQAFADVVELVQAGYDDEQERGAAILREKFGEEGADHRGEFFKLNQLVYQQRIEKGGFHDVFGNGINRKLTSNPALRGWRAARRYAYDKWYRWSEEEGWRGKAKKVGALAVLGVATGAATSGLAGVGIAGASAAGFITRATRNYGIAHIERRAAVHRAGADREDTADRLRQARQAAEQALESDTPISRILTEEFTNPANKQAKKNKLQPLLGFVAVAGLAEFTRLARDYWSIIHGGPVHIPSIKPSHPPTRLGPSVKPLHPKLPHSPRAIPPKAVLSRPIFIHAKAIGHQYLSTVYERAEGLHRGFTDMIHAANAAAHRHLIRIVHTHGIFFLETSQGKSSTKAVLKALSPFSRLKLRT